MIAGGIAALLFVFGVANAELTPPILLEATEPTYPQEARAAGESGTVHLKISLDDKGEVTQVRVLEGPSAALREAALLWACSSRFTPARYGSKPVAVVIDYRLRFDLPRTVQRGAIVVYVDHPGADVAVTVDGIEHHTDSHGYARFEGLSQGRHALLAWAPGFLRTEKDVEVDAGEQVSIHLQLSAADTATYETRVPTSRGIQDLQRAPLADSDSATVSHYTLTRRDIELTAGSLEDVSRTLQSLPGVVADQGLLATFFVRGSDGGDVIFYLDGMPLLNPFHLGGFATLFNPELIDGVDFYAGGAPSSYRRSLGGVVDIRYSGGKDKLQAVGDLSMNTAKAIVRGPLGGGATFLLAARRSYFEAYFAGLRDLGVVGRNFGAPDFGEYVAKASLSRGNQQLESTFVYSTDGLHFASTQGEDSLVSFDGELRLHNRTWLLSAKWRYQPRPKLSTTAFLGYTSDASTSFRKGGADDAGALLTAGDAHLTQLVARYDVALGSKDGPSLHAGLDASTLKQAFVGHVTDTRSLPVWASLPLASYHTGTLDVAPRSVRHSLELYLEGEWPNWLARLTPRLGVRLALQPGSPALLSPQAALGAKLWPGCRAKLSLGRSYARPTDPVATDATVGNPNLKAEQAWQAILGVEQLLPAGVVVRSEGYFKRLDHLIVTPDFAAPGVRFQNRGSGVAYGLDVLVGHRSSRFDIGATYGLLISERYNPLHAVFVRRYPPLQDQRHTFGATADIKLTDAWVLAARLQVSSGRPYTPITGFEATADGVWIPILGEPAANGRRLLNDLRRPPFYELSARCERWWRYPSFRATLYAEVLNIFNRTIPYVDTYDAGDAASGVAPTRGSITTLPIRPFLGIRVEY